MNEATEIKSTPEKQTKNKRKGKQIWMSDLWDDDDDFGDGWFVGQD